MKLNHINPLVRYVFARYTFEMPGQRLFYIPNGSGTGYINGESYAFSKDTLCLWNAGTVYFWDCNGEIDFICVNFDYIQAYDYKPGFLSIIPPDQFDTAPVFAKKVGINPSRYKTREEVCNNEIFCWIQNYG